MRKPVPAVNCWDCVSGKEWSIEAGRLPGSLHTQTTRDFGERNHEIESVW
jgi:hypothetical protein